MSKVIDIEIIKFGSGCLVTTEAAGNAAAIVGSGSSRKVIVVSATGGITELLISAAQKASNGDLSDIDFALGEFRRRNLDLLGSILNDPSSVSKLRSVIEATAEEFKTISQAAAISREFTPRSINLVIARGELISSMIFCARLNQEKISAVMVDATQLIFVSREFANLVHSIDKCKQSCQDLIIPMLSQNKVAVVPGFIATGADGELVTLGKGGSDYSATILAQALDAQKVTLYKDVDGFLTADPELVPHARIIPELNYREATELAYYGARVLHPRTIIPLLSSNIPLTIKNIRSPSFSGSRISDEIHGKEFPVKALTAMRCQCLVTVSGSGMMGVPGIAGKTFSTLAQIGISVSVITQASSESSICFIVPEEDSEQACKNLNDAFAFERSVGLVDDVKIDKKVAVLAVVGYGMRGTPGIAARVFAALSRKNINILAIAQGSSELNISVVVLDRNVSEALLELHGEFRLEKLRPLPARVEKHVDLVVLGSGQIGRTFIKQSLEQKSYFKNQLGVELGYISVIDSTGPRINMGGFKDEELLGIVQEKAKGGKLRESSAMDIMGHVRHEIFTHAVGKGVLVDMTASDTYDTVMEFIDQGYHIVLANKRPLTASFPRYQAMLDRARAKGVALMHEATVGAGLPVLDTIAKLQASGDKIYTVLGCLSGTLGYISNELSQGTLFSNAVAQAWRQGYTEPHPADDLSGMDVARKALILARKLGMNINLEEIDVNPLFPAEIYCENPQDFLERLKQLDSSFAALVQDAAQQGNVIRYVARIDSEKVSVGQEFVPVNSPLGRLQGTDNQIVIRTKRYDTNPLIVTGPGAGAEVTAAGVINDVIAIAVSHFGN